VQLTALLFWNFVKRMLVVFTTLDRITSQKGEGLENCICKVCTSYFGDILLEELGIQNAKAYSADGLLTERRDVY
jgi:RNase P/RNase MRP subunit POP5